MTAQGSIQAGPEKVIPICVAADKFPYLHSELKLCHSIKANKISKFQIYDCFISVTNNKPDLANNLMEKQYKFILNILNSGPHTLNYIAEHIGTDPAALPIEALVYKGYVRQISFTPTDLLHVTGQYKKWDEKSSQMVLKLISEILDMSFDETVKLIHETVVKKLVFSCIQSAADFEKKKCIFSNDPAALYLLEKSFSDDPSDFLNASFKLEKPIIAVGAPVKAWMPYVAEKLKTNLIIPEHDPTAYLLIH